MLTGHQQQTHSILPLHLLNKTYDLFVREYDEAGNVSDENAVESSFSIWADLSYTSEPSITLQGLELRNSQTLNITWTWASGLATTNEDYAYRLIDSGGINVIPVTDGTYNELPLNTATVTLDISAYADGDYTLEVKEYNELDSWNDTNKHGTNDIIKDATAPIAPNFTYRPGSNEGTYYLTNDTTPTWQWASGGGGNGSYRWSFDESTWTYTNSYYVTPSKAQGVYTFYVQERDDAGNWSISAEHNLEIDTTAPTLSSITLNNQSTDAWNLTSYTVSNYVNIDISGSGTNGQTYTSNDIEFMRLWNSGGTKTGYLSYNTSYISWYLGYGGGSLTDGSKGVYCELIDYAGNISVSRIDYITKDTVVPVVSSFSLNSGATTSTSSTVTLNSTLTIDAYAMRMSNDGGVTWSGWYGDSTSMSWGLSTVNGYSGYGAKKVMVQFTDIAGYYCRNNSTQLAGHDTDKQDSIFYGTPVIGNSYKGITNNGYIRTYYEDFEDLGDSTNTYYIYYATSPTGTKTQKGSTTHYANYSNSTYAMGTLYYLFVRVYNPDIGWSNYSTYSIGFSSDMTIVYDDTDTADTSVASTTKQWITRDWAGTYPTSYSFQSGSYIAYTVTLVPESLIPTTYSDSGYDTYDETIVYGNPIITTPSTALLYSSAYTYSRAKNITFGAKGLMGMHYYGWRLFQTINNYAAGWGYVGTLPSGLNYAYNKGDTQQAGTKEYLSSYDYIWHRYLKHDSTYTNYRNDPDYKVTMFTTSTTSSTGLAHRWSIYNSAASGTNGLYYWADDPDYPNYYTAARQGEFAYWGYNKLPGYVNAGIPFFYNTIRYLNSYY